MEVCGQRLPWLDADIATTYLHRKHGVNAVATCA